MSDKALVVFTFAGQQEMLDRHMDGYRKGGADIIVVSPCDAPARCPSDAFGLNIGRSKYCGAELTYRIGTALSMIGFCGYETICCIEGDSIVLGEIPEPPLIGVGCIPFDSSDPSFKARQFCHWPWIMSPENAETVGEAFLDAIQSGDIEYGFPDRLLGLICESNNIPLTPLGDMAWSCNLIDSPARLGQARDAIRNGARFVHGVKTREVFDALTA